MVRAREDANTHQPGEGLPGGRAAAARGEAQEILREAEGYKEQRVLLAQGEASRFLSVLAEYEKSKK